MWSAADASNEDGRVVYTRYAAMKASMILLYVPLAAAYLVAAWIEWRRLALPGMRETAAIAALAFWLPPCAIGAHVILLANTVVTLEGLDLSLTNALSAVECLIALIAWLGTLSRALPGIAAIAYPVAAAGAALPALIPSAHRFSFTSEPWAVLHIAAALVAYALLIVAALQALVLTGLERRLHRGLPEAAEATLPPLLTLERFLFRVVGAGFVLLTLTLISGVLFSEQLFGKALNYGTVNYSNKIIFSVLSWIVFGALLYGRKRYGWRGRTALNWIMVGSVLLLLAYVGTKLLPDSTFGA
jgi:ABC-type uncharacterized transport system permease subunit